MSMSPTPEVPPVRPDQPASTSSPTEAVPGPAAPLATMAEVTAEEAQKKASWIIRVSIFNPYLVIVLALFIVVLGAVCLWGEKPIPVDLLPAYKTPAVQVLTLYPGMPAEIV